jgi:hypothetical protein
MTDKAPGLSGSPFATDQAPPEMKFVNISGKAFNTIGPLMVRVSCGAHQRPLAFSRARCGKRSKYSFVANGAFTPAPWNYNLEWTPLFEFSRAHHLLRLSVPFAHECSRLIHVYRWPIVGPC